MLCTVLKSEIKQIKKRCVLFCQRKGKSMSMSAKLSAECTEKVMCDSDRCDSKELYKIKHKCVHLLTSVSVCAKLILKLLH